MLEVGGRPILSHNVAMLARAGFDDIVVNLHHLPNVVRDYLGDGARWGVHTTYSEETELRGTAGALVPVADRLSSETFAIVFGDNIAELDMIDMLRRHRSTEAVATVAVWLREDVSQSGVAEMREDGRITRFLEKPRSGDTMSHWINAGIILAEPALIDAVPRERPSDLGRDVLPRLIAAGQPVYGYPMSGGLWWFDSVEEYRAALVDARLAAFLERSGTSSSA